MYAYMNICMLYCTFMNRSMNSNTYLYIYTHTYVCEYVLIYLHEDRREPGMRP